MDTPTHPLPHHFALTMRDSSALAVRALPADLLVRVSPPHHNCPRTIALSASDRARAHAHDSHPHPHPHPRLTPTHTPTTHTHDSHSRLTHAPTTHTHDSHPHPHPHPHPRLTPTTHTYANDSHPRAHPHVRIGTQVPEVEPEPLLSQEDIDAIMAGTHPEIVALHKQLEKDCRYTIDSYNSMKRYREEVSKKTCAQELRALQSESKKAKTALRSEMIAELEKERTKLTEWCVVHSRVAQVYSGTSVSICSHAHPHAARV
jgi:hypothetical protein